MESTTAKIANEKLPKIETFFDRVDGVGTCKICSAEILTTNSGTTAMHRHIENKHNKHAYKRPPKSKSKICNDTNVSNIDILSTQFPLEAKLARMTACDGISFHLFETSKDLRSGIEASLAAAKSNEKLAKHSQAIKEAVMRFSVRVKTSLTTNFQSMLKNGQFFSINFDEWTSMANRRYLNLSIFGQKDQHWNLGLVRITGKATAENLLELVNGRLGDFGISAEKHIVAFITDGAKVMEKLNKISLVEHQLCLVHGIQLAVIDVLYSKKNVRVEVEDLFEDDEGSFDTENEVLNSVFELDVADIATDFRSQTMQTVISKVRKLGTHFKRSAVDNEKLQDIVRSKLGKTKPLKIDSRTRWSSLYHMIERYWEIKDYVDEVMKNIKGIDVKVSVDEKCLLLCILRTLEPVMLTVEILCMRDSNLLHARAALHELFDQLGRQNNPLSCNFARRLKIRIQERWSLNASVIGYLNNGSYLDLHVPDVDSTDDVNDDDENYSSRFFASIFEGVVDRAEDSMSLDIFDLPAKDVIKGHLIKLITRLCPSSQLDSDSIPPESSDESVRPPEKKKRKTFQERLNSAVSRVENQTGLIAPKESSAISKKITQEMNFLEKNKTRGPYLEKCYKMLKTIKPTSVESERAFSSAGALCTKFRTRYNDDTLDTLAFLRSHLRPKTVKNTAAASLNSDKNNEIHNEDENR